MIEETASIAKMERLRLSKLPMPDDCIGYDCSGQIIKEGDVVEVVVAEKERSNDPEYTFCSPGKRGIAKRHFGFPCSWCVSVTFENGSTVGCGDSLVRLVTG